MLTLQKVSSECYRATILIDILEEKSGLSMINCLSFNNFQ